LPDGSEIRLTTSRYHTPSGRSIQKPYDDDKKSYLLELNQRLESGEFLDIENVKLPDSLLFKTANGRKVYGGGGIMPDIFVPIDTARLDAFYMQMTRNNVFAQFVSDYLQKNRKKYQRKYSNVQELKSEMLKNSNELVEEITVYATTLGIERDTLNPRTQEFMVHIVVGLIARGVFDENAYFQVVSSIDDEFIKALNVLRDDTKYKSILK